MKPASNRNPDPNSPECEEGQLHVLVVGQDVDRSDGDQEDEEVAAGQGGARVGELVVHV